MFLNYNEKIVYLFLSFKEKQLVVSNYRLIADTHKQFSCQKFILIKKKWLFLPHRIGIYRN